MENFWAAITRGVQTIGTHWASYTIVGSFFLYVSGYLVLRYHIWSLGIYVDISVIDERYVFAGVHYLIYVISLVPGFVLLIFIFILILPMPIYLLYRILPSSIRVKAGSFFIRQWQSFLSWWLVPNRLAWLGIFLSLLTIQIVMIKCIHLNNLLLKEHEISWLTFPYGLFFEHNIDRAMSLYFHGLLGVALATASLLYVSINRPDQTTKSRIINSMFGSLVCVQLLLFPVNYGVLLENKTMPQVTGLHAPGTLKPNEQAWRVWEGDESITFFLRKREGDRYLQSLITLPKKEIQSLEISGYDHISQIIKRDSNKSKHIEEQ